MRNRYVGRTFIEGQQPRRARCSSSTRRCPRCWQASGCCWSRTRIVRTTTMQALLQRHPRPRRGAGDPRPRRLPADHRPVLLRHRHVHGEGAVRRRASCTESGRRREEQTRWPSRWGPTASSTCRWRRSRAASGWRISICAALSDRRIPDRNGQTALPAVAPATSTPSATAGPMSWPEPLPRRADLDDHGAGCAGGHASTSAVAAQPLAAIEMNWFFP